jgi:hypothetical protein
MSTSSFIPKARTADLVVQQVDDETMVYDLVSHQAHCLNRTASEIWKNCDGQTSVSMISERIGKNLGAGVEQELVMLAVTELSERRLLENEEIQPRMADRREVLRKIAFGVVAAPIIYTLVAPSALASASCACVNPGACITQTTCPSQVNCNAGGVCAP